jgi:hypothetical protein
VAPASASDQVRRTTPTTRNVNTTMPGLRPHARRMISDIKSAVGATSTSHAGGRSRPIHRGVGRHVLRRTFHAVHPGVLVVRRGDRGRRTPAPARFRRSAGSLCGTGSASRRFEPVGVPQPGRAVARGLEGRWWERLERGGCAGYGMGCGEPRSSSVRLGGLAWWRGCCGAGSRGWAGSSRAGRPCPGRRGPPSAR